MPLLHIHRISKSISISVLIKSFFQYFLLFSILFASPGYENAVALLEAGETNVDFTQLRLDFYHSSNYSPFPADRQGEEMVHALLKKGEQDRALSMTLRLLKKDYVNIDTHMLAATIYRKQGMNEQFQKHIAIIKGLMSSIISTGNGSSREKAIRVILPREELSVLKAKRLKYQEQKTEHSDKIYDIYTIENSKDGLIGTMYFDATLIYNAMERHFEGN